MVKKQQRNPGHTGLHFARSGLGRYISGISIQVLTESVGRDKIAQKELSVKSDLRTQCWRTPTLKVLAEAERSAQGTEMYHQAARGEWCQRSKCFLVQQLKCY